MTPQLEQQPCEDMEVIQVSKGALKSRQGRFVIYDVDWLKKNFYLEENLYGQPKQPKRGKWIEQNDTSKHHYGWYYCSECGAYIMSKCNYCSYCGSYNGEEADE